MAKGIHWMYSVYNLLLNKQTPIPNGLKIQLSIF